ncbi:MULTISPECIES: TonB-dependent receptor [unclassified Oceanobacter]|uniref:TonB-dependent receptor n=1 Tax=unclassified Oceanobacter TaxID=2620260 RepID=UPI0027322DD3|nr:MULTISPECIES: TonB-dependent receptor [unclassified Oceanobacter]MDP2608646.1 TonB-dependent receptor [Oceanobacter sp. 1_MG-2023]MDP2611742.1 TonB-dependent receptor [Oceanobacter sp. 2_MG-2023]
MNVSDGSTCFYRVTSPVSVPLAPLTWAVLMVLSTRCALVAAEDKTTVDTHLPTEVEDAIVVVGQQEAAMWYPSDQAASQRTVSQEELDMFAAPGAGSPYSAVSALPGVQAETVDPFGFGNLMGGNKGLRVRGVNASHGANGTVEGVAVTGMGPGPGYLWMFEQENIASVSLHQGPVPADQVDLFNNFGALDTRLYWPNIDPEVQLSYSAGSDDLARWFARADSGAMNFGGRVMASLSKSSADQWRGPGQAADQNNISLAGEQQFGALTARLWYTRSEGEQHAYRALSAEQANDLEQWYDYAYSSDPEDLHLYYDHNRQQFNSDLWLLEARYQLSDQSYISVQPYQSNEEGDYWSATSSGMIRNWSIDHKARGVRTEWVREVKDTRLSVGHWYMTMEPPGPPTDWKMYQPQADGSLMFSKWSLLAKVTNEHQMNSVWTQLDRSLGNWHWSAGLRYVRETLVSLDYYNTDGLGDVSYAAALQQSSGPMADRSVDGFDLDVWLPVAGLSYRWNDDWLSRIHVGRSMGAPSFSSWNQFQSNYSTFAAAGLTAQDVMDKQRIETQDGIDLGLTWTSRFHYMDLTVYYARFRNKGISYYDPDVAVVYSQNVGDGHQQGLQFAGGLEVTPELNLLANLAWTHAVLDKDVLGSGGTVMDVSGNQLPDVPVWTGALGARWEQDRWFATSMLRYVGQRYADSGHEESVPGYARVDMGAGYQLPLASGDLSVDVNVVNLTDKRYIGRINASDVQSTGSYTYYSGAPRSYLMTLAYIW